MANDPVDKGHSDINVLDKFVTVRKVRASGFRMHIPDIPNVGRLCQRYPIMPIHGEGSGSWKELEALKDVILSPERYAHMYREDVTTLRCTPVCATTTTSTTTTTEPTTTTSQLTEEKILENGQAVVDQIKLLTDQLLHQQLYIEEVVRSSGNSGLKQVRNDLLGLRPYSTASHSDNEMFSAMHNHPDNARKLGLGQIVTVMNGVESRTGHGDYYLTHDGSMVDIPFPEVPPEVTSQPDVNSQIIEMREWFLAWKNQDNSTRNYTHYFKPVLCYLQGLWEPIEEYTEQANTSWDMLNKVCYFPFH